MKQILIILLFSCNLSACNNEIKVNDKKLNKLEVAGKDLQKTVKKGVDTVASKVKKLKNKIDDNINSSSH